MVDMKVADPIELKLSFFSSDRSVLYLSAIKPFVDAVNAEAKNLIHIQTYPGGMLGKDVTLPCQPNVKVHFFTEEGALKDLKAGMSVELRLGVDGDRLAELLESSKWQ